MKNDKIRYLRAVNVEEAVAKFNQYPKISLVLMDNKIPVMDGYTATRVILEARRGFPINRTYITCP